MLLVGAERVRGRFGRERVRGGVLWWLLRRLATRVVLLLLWLRWFGHAARLRWHGIVVGCTSC